MKNTPSGDSAKSSETLASRAADRLVRRFMELKIGKLKIATPYWMNFCPEEAGTEYYRGVSAGGKENPSTIIAKTKEVLSRRGIDITKVKSNEVLAIMKKEGIGVDCSGLAYQVAETVYKALGGRGFVDQVIGRLPTDRGVRRTAARDLTDPKNSLRLNPEDKILPGDLIRCRGGKHVVVVLSAAGNRIICGHSTFGKGVELITITTTKSGESIFSQQWTDDEGPISGPLNQPVNSDDGVWRLRIINDLYFPQSKF